MPMGERSGAMTNHALAGGGTAAFRLRVGGAAVRWWCSRHSRSGVGARGEVGRHAGGCAASSVRAVDSNAAACCCTSACVRNGPPSFGQNRLEQAWPGDARGRPTGQAGRG
eukprot:scaffold21580_cov65-Phaeocystis_antarctica.AAC.1